MEIKEWRYSREQYRDHSPLTLRLCWLYRVSRSEQSNDSPLQLVLSLSLSLSLSAVKSKFSVSPDTQIRLDQTEETKKDRAVKWNSKAGLGWDWVSKYRFADVIVYSDAPRRSILTSWEDVLQLLLVYNSHFKDPAMQEFRLLKTILNMKNNDHAWLNAILPKNDFTSLLSLSHDCCWYWHWLIWSRSRLSVSVGVRCEVWGEVWGWSWEITSSLCQHCLLHQVLHYNLHKPTI